MSIVQEIIKKIPKPNYHELPELYEELDSMAEKIGSILVESKIFDQRTNAVSFDKASEGDIRDLIMKEPYVMVPFFVMVCGFSDRELERLYGIKEVYSLRHSIDEDKLKSFVRAVLDNLKHPINLEALLYKFYKNWEEHQKRHYRGRTAEKYIIEFLKRRGYKAGKISKVRCEGKEREIDCAIPPSPSNLQVIIMVRHGVFRDLVKRAKEFSSEFDELSRCFPQARFVVVYLVSPHERDRVDEIRSRIIKEREGKRPYDLVILTPEELELLLKKLEEWGVPKFLTSSLP